MRARLKRLTAYAAAVVLLVTSGITMDVSAADAEGNTQEITVTYGQTEARTMFEMINDFRTGDDAWAWDESNENKISYDGLSELQYDPVLEEVAMQRAAEIAVYYSHTRPNGSDCFTAYPAGYNGKGENIAYGYESAEAVFIAWREDNEDFAGQGHRRNMLGNFNAVGIGHVTYNGVEYWVQEFGLTANPIKTPGEAVDGQRTVSIEMPSAEQTVTAMSIDGKTVTYSLNNVPDILQGFAGMLTSVTIETNRGRTYTIGAQWEYDEAANVLKLKDGTYTLPSNLSDPNGILEAGIALQRISTDLGPWDAEKYPVTSRTVHEGQALSITLNPVYIENSITGYSWYKLENGVLSAISGATGKTYEKTDISADDAGKYVAVYEVYGQMCITPTKTVTVTQHTWDEGKITTEPGETTEGVKTYTCTYAGCGATKTETIPPTGEHKHTVVTDPAVEATCTDPGLTEGSHCSVCHEVLVAQQEVPALGHKWDNGTVTKEATCGKAGEKTYTCERCKTTKTEEIPATGEHTVVTDPAVEATCTDPGLTEGSHCSVCHEVLVAQQEVPALGHKWDNGTVTKEATCGKAGEKTYTCERCKTTKTEEIPATGEHTVVTDPAVEATCTKTGLTEGSHCSVCGEVIVKQEVVPMKDHSYGEGVVTKEPTCTETGEMTYTCSVCGGTKTEAVDKLEHTAKTLPAVEPTCTESGLTEGSVCAVCGTTLVEQNVVEPLGHDWDEGEVISEATCTEAGAIKYTCKRCEETKTVAVDEKGHTPEVIPGKDATCKDTGLTEGSKCSVCGVILKEQEVIPVLTEHAWDEGTVLEEATCTKDGQMLYTCTVCETTKTETIEAPGHTVVIDPAVDPTYTEEGLTEGSHCSVCGEILKEQMVVPKLEKPAGGDENNGTTGNTEDTGNTTGAAGTTGTDNSASNTANKAVKTGDTGSILPTAVMLIASLSVIGAVLVGKKRRLF